MKHRGDREGDTGRVEETEPRVWGHQGRQSSQDRMPGREMHRRLGAPSATRCCRGQSRLLPEAACSGGGSRGLTHMCPLSPSTLTKRNKQLLLPEVQGQRGQDGRPPREPSVWKERVETQRGYGLVPPTTLLLALGLSSPESGCPSPGLCPCVGSIAAILADCLYWCPA